MRELENILSFYNHAQVCEETRALACDYSRPFGLSRIFAPMAKMA